MSDVWQPIDDTARSGELFKVRFAPLQPGQERRELTARYLGVGAWAVYENGKSLGTALNAVEWQPLRD